MTVASITVQIFQTILDWLGFIIILVFIYMIFRLATGGEGLSGLGNLFGGGGGDESGSRKREGEDYLFSRQKEDDGNYLFGGRAPKSGENDTPTREHEFQHVVQEIRHLAIVLKKLLTHVFKPDEGFHWSHARELTNRELLFLYRKALEPAQALNTKFHELAKNHMDPALDNLEKGLSLFLRAREYVAEAQTLLDKHADEHIMSLVNKALPLVRRGVELILEIGEAPLEGTLSSQEDRSSAEKKDPYYLHDTNNALYVAASSGIGIFNHEESFHRLFREQPVFDKDLSLPLGGDYTSLLRAYWSSGDCWISDFSSYRREIEELVTRSPRMKPQTKMVLVIPSYLEERNIRKTLERYASLEGIEKTAIILFENRPVEKERDGTVEQIRHFRREHKNVQLYHLYKAFERKAPIGYIRKFATEYALLLAFRSGIKNFIIVGGDADCIAIDKDFFSRIRDAFATNPFLDAVELKLDFPEKYLHAYPTLWVLHRVFDFSWKYFRRKISQTQEIRLYGPASAILASSYLLIKGFNPRTTLCEDLQLSWLLDEGRRNSSKRHFQFVNARIVSNPRRALSAFFSGVGFLDQYSNFRENDAIRGLDWEQLVEQGKGILEVGNTFTPEEIRNAINEGASGILARTLAYNLQRYVDWWGYKVEVAQWLSQEQFADLLRRVMGWLGIRYRISFDTWTFEILDVEKLLAFMNRKTAGEIRVNPATYRRGD